MTTVTAAKPFELPAKVEQREQQPMDDELFQQFFQSLASDDGTASSWVSPDWLFEQQSVHSSPEIATPHDLFLASPPTPARVSVEEPLIGKQTDFGDLDVSALLNAPLTDVSPPIQPLLPAAAAISTQGQLPVINLFHDLPPVFATLGDSGSPLTPPAIRQIQEPQAHTVITPIPMRKRTHDQAASDNKLDEAAIKRQKNTDAARRSRLRKVLKMEALEKRVAELEKINTTLLLRAAVLESEKSSFLAKESSFERRIKDLEAQLADAHKSLAALGRSTP